MRGHACGSLLDPSCAHTPPASPPRRYEQGWPPRARRFSPYVLLKVVFNALILNYAASAFIVSACSSCTSPCDVPHQSAITPCSSCFWRAVPVLLHTGPARPAVLATKHGCAPPSSRPAWLQVLWLSDCMAIWRSVYFCGHLAILAIIAVGIVLPPRKPKRDVKPEQAAGKVDGVEAAPAVPAVPVGAPMAPFPEIAEQKKEQ